MRTHADARNFPALLRAFEDELRLHNYSSALVLNAARVLPRLFDHLKKNRVRDIRAVTEAHLLDFTHRLAKTPTTLGKLPAPNSMNGYVNIVRRFFAHLVKRGVILQDVSRVMPTRQIKILPRYVISEREAHKLMGAPNPCTWVGRRDRAILETMYGSAVRLAECVRLDVADVDLKGGTLLVRNGKGKKDRVVPVTKRAVLAIADYLAEGRPGLLRDPREPALFLAAQAGCGRRIARATLALLVKAYARGVGVKLSPHGLRHACATHLLRGGADVLHVQRVLGHRNIDSTAIYTRVAMKDLREVLERTHPRDLGAERARKHPRKKT